MFSFFSLIFCEILPGGSVRKEYACNAGDLGLILGLGRCSGEGDDKPLQYSCLENPRGQRGLEGCSPWGCRGSATSERLSTRGKEPACLCRKYKFNPWVGHSSPRGKGHPLQYSCLGNPMDRGAWQATAHGVAKNWTQLSD